MTLALQVLSQTIEAMDIKFYHADMFDANLGIDQIPAVEFAPCIFLYVPPTPTKNKVTTSGSITRRIEIEGFFLFKFKQQTTQDSNTTDVEDIIAAAKLRCDNLIHRLNLELITDTETNGIDSFEYIETYAMFDENLFGVRLTFEWPVNEGTNGCL